MSLINQLEYVIEQLGLIYDLSISTDIARLERNVVIVPFNIRIIEGIAPRRKIRIEYDVLVEKHIVTSDYTYY